MNFINSSELISIDGKNYLQIFFDRKYPYKIKHNSEELEVLDMLFKEPDMDDLSDLMKLSVSLEKLFAYENVKTIRIANSFSKDALESFMKPKATDEEFEEDDIENLQDQIEKEDKEEESEIENNKRFISKLLSNSSDFEDESSHYYLEIAKFIKFLDSKCFRNQELEMPVKCSLSNLDQYGADSLFLKEEILIQYLSFFLSHFPSKSLHQSLRG